jgi:hypothetical protein
MTSIRLITALAERGASSADLKKEASRAGKYTTKADH